jgi:hypothetical protein
MNPVIRRSFRYFTAPWVLTVITLFAFATGLQATIMQFLDVEDLTAISSHVFLGEVLSSQPQWSDDHKTIYTSTKIRISETFKGTLSDGQVITINQLGGELDGIAMDYAGRPTFTVGEYAVVFATQPRKGSFVVTALKQGKMQIQGDTVVRDFSGITLVNKNGSGRNAQSVQKPIVRFSLNELRTRITRSR